jgi:DNA/RNA endonuclease G (NUC1)
MTDKWVHIHRTIGTFPRLITVPTHFFKIIIGKQRIKNTNEFNLVVGAFLVPNVDTVDKMVNEIKRQTVFIFVPRLIKF